MNVACWTASAQPVLRVKPLSHRLFDAVFAKAV
jgi:hypothetical protein